MRERPGKLCYHWATRNCKGDTGKLTAWEQLTVGRGEQLVWGRRTYVMGIINLSPDSFSGDGLGSDLAAIEEQGLLFAAEGADFLDVVGVDPAGVKAG